MTDVSDYTQLLGQTLEDLGPRGDLLRQQAIGADIQNRTQALQLQYMQQLPAALAASSSSAGGVGSQPASADPEDWAHITPGQDTESGLGVNGPAMTQHLQARYAPIPGKIYTPQEWNAMNAAQMAGKPELAKMIADRHQMQIDAVNQQRQNSAIQKYNNLFGVVSAPEGQAIDALSVVDPDAASQLKDSGASDADVRNFAAQFAGALHTSARLPVEYRKEDGKAVDAGTKLPVPGYNLAVGLGPEQILALKKSATEMIDTRIDGRDVKKPRWDVEGATSADDWVQQHANVGFQLRHGGAPVSPLGGGTPGPTAVSSSVAAPSASAGAQPTVPWVGSDNSATSSKPSAAPSQPPQQSQSSPQNQPPRSSAQQSNQIDPALKSALSDTSYRVRMPTAPPGGSFLPDEQKERDNIVESRNTLLKDSQEATQAAAQSMTYLKAAKSIMDSKGATVGAYGGLMAQLSKWTPFTGNVDATNYQEVAKYLGNAALAAAKGTYGSKMTQSEVGLQLNELSPSVHMTDDAINNLLGANIRNAQYTIDSAKRASRYIAAGNDPRRFREWNEDKFPQNQSVNASRDSSSVRLPTVKTQQDLAALPSGARFVGPDGKTRVKH